MSIEIKPGLGKDCEDCAKRLPKPGLYTESYCSKVESGSDAGIIFIGLTGYRRNCLGYERTFPVFLRDLALKVSEIINIVGPSMPRF